MACMAALLLKKKYLDKKETISRLPKEKLSMIATSVTGMMNPDRQVMFLKRCCEILVRICSFLVLIDLFQKVDQELVNIIQSMGGVESLNMKLALMYLIEITCESAFDDNLLMGYSSQLIAIFDKNLGDPANEVQVATFKTLTVFLSTITEESNMKQFNPLLKNILSKAIELIKFDQETGVAALESLNELIEAHPKFIKPIFDNLLKMFSEIMETPQLLVSLRSTAMSGILTLCTNHHSSVRKNEHFKTRMVPAYMKMLAEIDRTPLEEWAEELLDEQSSKNDISMVTEEHLVQIAEKLGNRFILPLFIPYIQQCLSSQEICYQHAGLTAMALLVENCHASFKTELKNMVGLMLPMLRSDNPRIIYDILIAMGYMATEFAPEIQVNFGAMILEFITNALKHPLLKVQYKAVQCIVNFEQGIAENTEVKVMEPFLNSILGDLSRIFENALSTSNFIMLESVLETLSVIASCNNFAPYYQTFMPGLTRVVAMITSDTPQKINIKSKTIEAMGDILSSIKDTEIFASECSNIMQSLMTLQSQIDSEDILNRAIMTVYENVVEVMKENFAMYSDFVFERAMTAALRPVDVQIVDELDKEKTGKKGLMHNFAKIKFDLKIDGIKNIVLNTDTFEQKVEASNLLSAMSEHMGSAYLKYAEHTVKIIKEIMHLKSSREIRGNMIDCCKFMVAAGTTQQQRYEILSQIEGCLSSALETAIKFKDNEEVCSITEAYSIVMPSMDEAMLSALPTKMMAVMGMVNGMTKEIENIYS